MTWAFRLGVTPSDLATFAAGAALIALVLAASRHVGDVFSLAALVALAIFAIVVVAYVAAPHVAIAATIPLFALLPSMKVVFVPWIGPLKDVIALAAIAAAVVGVVSAARGGRRVPGDLWTTALCAFIIALYGLNIGGGLVHDLAWSHGFRLVAEPLLLLLVGLTLADPRRTLDWALKSLISTASAVAAIGILQQVVGPSRLVEFGYEWNIHVRTISGHLRSFGTLDEPFAYAAFLVFGLCAVVMWMRPGFPAYLAGGVIVTGLAFSVVRSAFVIIVAIFALWLARHGRAPVAVFLLALAVSTMVVLASREQAMHHRATVQTNESLFLTVNGRTEAWRAVFDEPGDAPLGKGVDKVGLAAQRATFSVTRTQEEANRATGVVYVDSGYLAAVVGVGLVGLAALLLLLARLGTLAWRAAANRRPEGWIAASLLLALGLDAITRESFTAFPTAFLGLLLIGLALAAAREAGEEREGGASIAPERRNARRGRGTSAAARAPQ